MNTVYTGYERIPAARATDLGSPRVHRMTCAQWGAEPIPVIDISETGARLGLRPNLTFTPGMMFDTVLQLRNHFEHSVRVKIIHLQPDSFGVEFVDTKTLFKELIRTYFRHELLGAKLKPHDEAAAGKATTKWASKDGKDSLELVFENGKPRQFAVSLDTLSLHREWSDGADSGEALLALNAAELVRVIRNIQKMPADQRTALEDLLLSAEKDSSGPPN